MNLICIHSKDLNFSFPSTNVLLQKNVNNEIVTESDTSQTERQIDSEVEHPPGAGVYPNSSWRQQAPAFYCLEYTHPSSGPTIYTVTAVPMGASLVVHGKMDMYAAL